MSKRLSKVGVSVSTGGALNDACSAIRAERITGERVVIRPSRAIQAQAARARSTSDVVTAGKT